MPALELLTGITTAADTTFTALSMATGNSLTVRNTPDGADIRLVQAWSDHQTAGQVRIRSPRLHDNVQGIRMQAPADVLDMLLPDMPNQALIPQDTLVVDQTGSATAGDIETTCMLIYYSDLPGVDANLITDDELVQRTVAYSAIQQTLAVGVAGNYSGEEAINAEFDQFKGNTEYAIVGYLCQADFPCIRYRGSDWGNLGLGGPGDSGNPHLTSQFFRKLSMDTGLALIPVFNSANLANVLVDASQRESGTDPIISTIVAELS